MPFIPIIKAGERYYCTILQKFVTVKFVDHEADYAYILDEDNNSYDVPIWSLENEEDHVERKR